jgi:enoyl-CoA hydratase/carnithine racemase
MIIQTEQDGIYVVTLDDYAGNTFDLEFLASLHETMDAIETGDDAPGALVITGVGKAFSIGLNIEVLKDYTPEQRERFDQEIKRLYGRLINFPLPTIAAINGHAFAAGAVLALACDFRVMRNDRGWFCFSEVDVGVPIGPEIMAVAQAKLSPSVLRDAILTGKRFGGEECVSLGITDAVCSEDDLLSKALDIAKQLAGKERSIFKSLKSTLYGEYALNLDGNSLHARAKGGNS